MPHAYPAQVHAASRACRWCVPCAGLTLPGTEASALPVLPCALCASGLTFSPSQTRNMPVWLPGQDQPLPSRNCAIRAGDKGWWSLPACTLLPSSLTLVCLAEEGTLYSSGSLFQAARQDVPPPNQEPPAPKSGPPPPPPVAYSPRLPLTTHPASSGPSHAASAAHSLLAGGTKKPLPPAQPGLPLQSPMTFADRTTPC